MDTGLEEVRKVYRIGRLQTLGVDVNLFLLYAKTFPKTGDYKKIESASLSTTRDENGRFYEYLKAPPYGAAITFKRTTRDKRIEREFLRPGFIHEPFDISQWGSDIVDMIKDVKEKDIREVFMD